jgi:hypothetical protein
MNTLSLEMPEILEHDYEALPDNSSLTSNLIAGALAGIGEHAVMYPVDSVKVCSVFDQFSDFACILMIHI